MELELKECDYSNIKKIFEFHQDDEANYIAAFIRDDYKDYEKFTQRWEQILNNSDNNVKIIYYNNEIVGYICAYKLFSEINIGYWIDKNFWGRGIATSALKLFIVQIQSEKIFARVAYDNLGSIRVLEKCGFEKHSEELFYSSFRKKEIKELVYKYSCNEN